MSAINLKSLSDADLATLRVEVLTEQERRANLAAIPEQVTGSITRYEQIGGVVEELPPISRAQAQVVRGLRESGRVEAPPQPEDEADPDTYPEWQNPGTDHSRMYLLGDQVRHRGRIWESGVDMLNHWEPGSAHTVWVDITGQFVPSVEQPAEPDAPAEPAPEPEESAIPAWAPGMQLSAGDLVTHDGQTWRTKINHTSHDGWRPGPATHAVFEQA